MINFVFRKFFDKFRMGGLGIKFWKGLDFFFIGVYNEFYCLFINI